MPPPAIWRGRTDDSEHECHTIKNTCPDQGTHHTDLPAPQRGVKIHRALPTAVEIMVLMATSAT
ncbi:hypothetical protein [Cutibacterium granulosum]|uniref:hypothetical protein n=1 Tax=Cutibacterium granulosum TaxID=33011 RepID=UPI0023F639CD|nr:hypothetical protein [Cutibacterium granulosum]